ncbi:MAG: hypothetical protein U1F60_01190 [Planctomycetota bacterium]
MFPLPILARPTARYWWGYVLTMPLLGLILSGLLFAVGSRLLDHGPTPREARILWATVTALLTVPVLHFDRTRLHYELTATTLQLGRGSSAQVLHFADLDSVVLGLPSHTPRWIRLLGFHPTIRTTIRFVAHQRENAIYLRFRDGRFVPLFLSYRWLHRGPDLMVALRERLQEWFVAHDSYTVDEVAALKRPRWNRVRWSWERGSRLGSTIRGGQAPPPGLR